MRPLSKSKLMAWRQCPRRLWLEVHHRELREDPAASQVRFAVGDLVGALARSLYDPDENGILIEFEQDDADAGVARTTAALDRRVPIFEAGLEGGGARAFVDVLRPVRRGGTRSWELIEVKSSASAKATHRDDLAIQAYVAHAAGIPVAAAKLAHVDTGFVYRGDDDYHGLLRELDLTAEVAGRSSEVAGWIASARKVADLPGEPAVPTGSQCRTPYPCAFLRHCRASEAAVGYPVQLLPGLQGDLRRMIDRRGLRDLRELPDDGLSPLQLRVKQHTLSASVYFDRSGAAADLAGCAAPQVFLDFEAVQLAVPIWAGARPYQMFPFQFSLHTCAPDGQLEHHEFLDLGGGDPSRAFAQALVDACPATGTIFVWNASFELARIADLAHRFADLRPSLESLAVRIFDLLRVAEARYYHPVQRGSWKLKRVLPAFAPDLDHADLEGVNDGHMAMLAYIEAIQTETPPERRIALDRALRDYCRLDSLALYRVWRVLSGQDPGSPD